jgi:predicted nucleic-acid-binding Zn-ribbon protein
VDKDEFEKLLYKRGFKRPVCPTCGSASWHGVKDVFLVPGGSEGAVVNRGVRSISAACDTCGYLLVYDASILMAE